MGHHHVVSFSWQRVYYQPGRCHTDPEGVGAQPGQEFIEVPGSMTETGPVTSEAPSGNERDINSPWVRGLRIRGRLVKPVSVSFER